MGEGGGGGGTHTLSGCVCADATMSDAAWIHPAVELVDEEGLGRTMRAVRRVECGALLLREAPITLSSSIDELPEHQQATYRDVSVPPTSVVPLFATPRARWQPPGGRNG